MTHRPNEARPQYLADIVLRQQEHEHLDALLKQQVVLLDGIIETLANLTETSDYLERLLMIRTPPV